MKLPQGKKTLKNKLVFKLKTQEHTLLPKDKTSLVVKSFDQVYDINFDEISFLVVKMSSIHVVLCMTINIDLDVK